MPRKPASPPVIDKVIFNPDPDEGEEALVETIALLVEFILEDRATSNVDTPAVA